jgi:molybdenum cofactor cytidylyltransferase
MSVGAVVLAAGPGRRFGGGKLAAELHGEPILSHVCAAVVDALGAGVLGQGWVVVAADDRAARLQVERAGLVAVVNPNPEAGIAHSIRAGLDKAEAQPALEALLLLLGDQPLVRVVRPRYGDEPDTPGHPVLLDRLVWPLCRQVTGDRGLAGILPQAALIDVAGANPDIDTPADLHLLEDHP